LSSASRKGLERADRHAPGADFDALEHAGGGERVVVGLGLCGGQVLGLDDQQRADRIAVVAQQRAGQLQALGLVQVVQVRGRVARRVSSAPGLSLQRMAKRAMR